MTIQTLYITLGNCEELEVTCLCATILPPDAATGCDGAVLVGEERPPVEAAVGSTPALPTCPPPVWLSLSTGRPWKDEELLSVVAFVDVNM